MPKEAFSLDSSSESTNGVEGAAADILGAMPDPQQHVIDAAARTMTDKEKETATSVEFDKSGTAFDPLIHTGSKLKDGTWRKRKKPTQSTVAAPGRSKTQQTSEQLNQAQIEAKGRQAGMMAAHAFYMCGRLIGGDEWLPTIQTITVSGKDHVMDEDAMVKESFGDYFVAKNYTDFPPGIALSMTLFSYCAQRLTMPVTSARVLTFKQWAVTRWVAWRMGRKAKKAEEKSNDSRADSRNNSERKNDVREASSGGLQVR